MPKPGNSPNISNPVRSSSTGVSDAMSVASGSRQDAATLQTSSNPSRMNPAHSPAGPSGTADVEVSGVLDNQTSDASASLRAKYAKRKAIFG